MKQMYYLLALVMSGFVSRTGCKSIIGAGASSAHHRHPKIIHRYEIISNKTVSWSAAAKLCEGRGLRLAGVYSYFDQIAFAESLQAAGVTTSYFWLAGHRRDLKSDWKWVEKRGAAYIEQPVEFTNWATAFPDTRQDHCILSRPPSKMCKWINDTCSLKKQYACEPLPGQLYEANARRSL